MAKTSFSYSCYWSACGQLWCACVLGVAINLLKKKKKMMMMTTFVFEACTVAGMTEIRYTCKCSKLYIRLYQSIVYVIQYSVSSNVVHFWWYIRLQGWTSTRPRYVALQAARLPTSRFVQSMSVLLCMRSRSAVLPSRFMMSCWTVDISSSAVCIQSERISVILVIVFFLFTLQWKLSTFGFTV